MPKISIIIPMYNASEYIGRTLLSITSQAPKDTEILIVDDGSTDDSAMAVTSHFDSVKSSMEHKLITQPNRGVSAARNAGLKASSGQYVIFCDSDDEFCPGIFEAVSDHIQSGYDIISWPFYNEQNDTLSISQDTDGLTESSFPRNEYLKKHLFGGYKMRLGSFAVKKDLLTEHGILFDESCTLGEDVEFFMKALLCADMIYSLDKPYYIYHKHSGSLAYSYNIRRFEAPRAIERVYKYYSKNVTFTPPKEKSHTLSAFIRPLPSDIEEYMRNGLYILHAIYALDSCCTNSSKRSDNNMIYSLLKSEYPDVYGNIKEKISHMKTPPHMISRLRLSILRTDIRLYMLYIFIHG